MKIAVRSAIASAAIIGACAPAPSAWAESVDLGDTADIDVVDIEIEQHWTVSDLKPSNDAIPYSAAGTLWEATVTSTLDNGGVPIISGFSAHSDDSHYPVLWNVPSPLGISPNALPPGGSATGKIYFDATGAPPTSVAYTVNGEDTVVWD